MEKFEEQIHGDLQQYLLSVNKIDERLPECLDVEVKWETVANAYIPDGVREFQNYPLASLGWMMYIGMALAKMWDDDWQYYAAKEDLYVYLRDKRLMHQDIEPGTKEAFLAYVACLHLLYLFGVAVQLKRMGYHMTRI